MSLRLEAVSTVYVTAVENDLPQSLKLPQPDLSQLPAPEMQLVSLDYIILHNHMKYLVSCLKENPMDASRNKDDSQYLTAEV